MKLRTSLLTLTLLVTACGTGLDLSPRSQGDFVFCALSEEHTFSDSELAALRDSTIFREDRHNRVIERVCK